MGDLSIKRNKDRAKACIVAALAFNHVGIIVSLSEFTGKNPLVSLSAALPLVCYFIWVWVRGDGDD